ncbi:hypothetical protein BOX15_Mlig023955g1 [Macrostomum lignano]|uniref:Uncharacterized protein n=1 Tax=Macrostomum lignano TaxID=282301 RepID=A0A267DWI6_9PLAT|nr:hypothetical protein BOX15_Mlig023955g1 [Macrostomum lignano]
MTLIVYPCLIIQDLNQPALCWGAGPQFHQGLSPQMPSSMFSGSNSSNPMLMLTNTPHSMMPPGVAGMPPYQPPPPPHQGGYYPGMPQQF